MFIILEGPDLAGKTTLAKAIKKEFRKFTYFDYFKLRAKFKNNWMDYIDIVAETEYNCLKQLQDNDLILDRSFVSSIIYEKLYKRNYDLSYINKEDFSKALFIHVTVSEEVLMERVKDREEDPIIVQRLKDLRQEYIDYFNKEEFKYFVEVDTGRYLFEDNLCLVSKKILSVITQIFCGEDSD